MALVNRSLGSTYMALRKQGPKQAPPDIASAPIAGPAGTSLAYAAGRVAPQTTATPAGQYTPADIAAITGAYTAGLPKPSTAGQIQSQAQGEINPQLAQLQAAIAARAKSAMAAINGYTGSLATALAGENYGAPYQGAEQQQAAVDAALSQGLAGGGTGLASDLQSKLAQIGEPGVVGQATQAVAGQGAASGNTELASGSSALSNLIANATAATSYGQKLPGIAKLAGLQDVSQAQGQASSDLASGTATIEQQLPGILNDLRSQSDSRASSIETLSSSLYKFLTGQNTTVAGQQAADKRSAATIAAENGRNTATIAAENSRSQNEIAAANGRSAAGRAAAQAPKFSASNSKTLGYLSDQYGNPWNGGTTGSSSGGSGGSSAPTSNVVAGRIAVWNKTHPNAAIDPDAANAVSSVEGASGAIGDGGHAFGPFQLNDAGGVLTGKFPGYTPAQINAWAWSPAGIDFALSHIASVAGGKKGADAVSSIVTGFERPKDIPDEITKADSALTGKTLLPNYTYDKNGNIVKKPTAPTPKTLSASETDRLSGLALTGAEIAFNGGTDPKGNPLPPLNYSDAILHGQQSGIPMAILIPALNRYYIPGDRGRPLTKSATASKEFFNSLNPVWGRNG